MIFNVFLVILWTFDITRWNEKKKRFIQINNLGIRDRIKDLLQNDFRALTELFFEKYMILNQKKKKKNVTEILK